MADDEFQSRLCTTSWWNTEAVDAKAAAIPSQDRISSVSGGSPSLQAPPPVFTAGFLLDPQGASFGIPSQSVDIWSQNFRGDDGSHSVSRLEEVELRQGGFHDSTTAALFREVSQPFLVGQRQLNETAASLPAFLFQRDMDPADLQAQQHDVFAESHGYPACDVNELERQMQWSRFQQQMRQQPAAQSVTPPTWIASAAPTDGLAGAGYYGSSLLSQYPSGQAIAATSSTDNNLISMKVKHEGRSAVAAKKSCSEPPLKRQRMEPPSPLPALKVRKEKLGDRITALQQLVSPFGKTDTASVLYEAIEYIKFLHDQVNVLSTPYLKNKHAAVQQHRQIYEKAKEGEGVKKDLRSRGLCLVPISNTFAVANEPVDFWTPTFGGPLR